MVIPALATWFAMCLTPNRWIRLLILIVSPLIIVGFGTLYQMVAPNSIPPFFVVVYGALIFLLGIVCLFARQKPRTHECQGCGYDLRGLEARHECPECGERTKHGLAAEARRIKVARMAAQQAHADAIAEARRALAETPRA